MITLSPMGCEFSCEVMVIVMVVPVAKAYPERLTMFDASPNTVY